MNSKESHSQKRATPGALDPAPLVALALAAVVLSLGPLDPAPLQAQTHASVLTGGAGTLQIQADARAEVEDALRRMNDADLQLAYARIHATFRQQLGAEDLRIARALIDYAALAQAELAARRLPLPATAEPAEAMLRLYELIL